MLEEIKNFCTVTGQPGASAQEMAECIRVDKATLTKVVRKLSQIGFLEIVDNIDQKIWNRMEDRTQEIK